MRRLCVLAAVFLSGCGFFKVSGLDGSGVAGSESGDAESRLKKVYDSFSPELCPNGVVGCGNALRKAAGVEERPHGDYDPVRMWNPREGANPDPEWITGWDGLPKSEGYNESMAVFEVIARAALSKSARKTCEADYQSTFDRRTRASRELDAAIDAALKHASEHDQVRALLALRPKPAAAGDDTPFVGARFRLEQEITRRFEAPSRRAILGRLAIIPDDLAEVRPLLSLEEESRYYCANHASGSQTGGAVRALYTADEIASVEQAVRDAKSLKAPADKGEEALTLNTNWAFKAPFFAVDEAKVTSIVRQGRGGIVTYEATRDETYPYGCHETNDRLVVQNGTVRKDTNCSYGTRTTTNSVTLTFADLPSGSLEKGDTLKLYARITDYRTKTIPGGPSKERVEQRFAGEGVVVVQAKRGAETVWKLSL